jgi:hypothetical protein
MIVQTTRINRKGGVQYLATHLLDKSDENDRIEVLAGDISRSGEMDRCRML